MVKDIKVINNELDFTGGDFVISDSDLQHQEDIISENIGSYKQYPTLGVGIISYLNSSGSEGVLRRSIQLNLQNDGYYVKEIRFSSTSVNEFTVDAERRSNEL
jgi:hypothetical protein